MKKILLILVLISGFILLGCVKVKKIGAENMNQEIIQVRAEHILVETEKEAIDLKNKIENKEITFEEAAKEFSKCPSGKNGGDLGFFARGVMVKPFEEAAFNAESNVITNPVQTQFGWHLIKVTDKKSDKN